jgi:hypothetical protein
VYRWYWDACSKYTPSGRTWRAIWPSRISSPSARQRGAPASDGTRLPTITRPSASPVRCVLGLKYVDRYAARCSACTCKAPRSRAWSAGVSAGAPSKKRSAHTHDIARNATSRLLVQFIPRLGGLVSSQCVTSPAKASA